MHTNDDGVTGADPGNHGPPQNQTKRHTTPAASQPRPNHQTRPPRDRQPEQQHNRIARKTRNATESQHHQARGPKIHNLSRTQRPRHMTISDSQALGLRAQKGITARGRGGQGIDGDGFGNRRQMVISEIKVDNVDSIPQG